MAKANTNGALDYMYGLIMVADTNLPFRYDDSSNIAATITPTNTGVIISSPNDSAYSAFNATNQPYVISIIGS